MSTEYFQNTSKIKATKKKEFWVLCLSVCVSVALSPSLRRGHSSQKRNIHRPTNWFRKRETALRRVF